MRKKEGQPVPTKDLETPRTVLAIGAHPDDIEFGCGATLAKWAAAGCEIHHVVCTDGSRGTWDPDEDPAELVVTREREQRAAARALGGRAEVTFLRWPDGELEAGLRQRWQVCDAIRRVRPDVVLGHDPWKRYRLHPDHRNAGFLVTDGIVAARDPLFFPEQGAAPHRPSTLLLFEADEPDHVEDVAATVDTKLAALLEHASQLHTTMSVTSDASSRDAQIAAFEARIRARLAEAGAADGIPAAEAFKRIDRL
ncbi:MAG TPA: PIG-L family deacetylase [Acidimicrobiales bacterium]|nr:PIG-L family deacetylase [Acidimicrobiales bacterium]